MDSQGGETVSQGVEIISRSGKEERNWGVVVLCLEWTMTAKSIIEDILKKYRMLYLQDRAYSRTFEA